MRDMDKQELAKRIKIITPLLAAYPNARITPDTFTAYALGLADIDEQSLSMAIAKCIKICKFVPTVAEIVEQVNNLTDQIKGERIKDGDEAWAEVTRQMEEAFVYKKPVFTTPEIEMAALSMGWIGLCETPTDQIGTARAQFLKIYESVCRRKKDNRVNENVLKIIGTNGQHHLQ